VAEQERLDGAEVGQEAVALVAEAPQEGRAARRRPHPAWRVGRALLIVMLMAASSWVVYAALVHVAGPPLAGPVQAYDPQGLAEIFQVAVRPLPAEEGEGVLITWTVHNLGSKPWLPSTHHWEPLYPDLPPLPLPRQIEADLSAQMAVRLEPPFGEEGRPAQVVGWRLMGLKGPVQNGQVEVMIRATDSPPAERK
jgi:hypothetical protein